MTTLTRWTMPDYYFGATWPDYYRSGFGQSRDSDCLEQSNFATALAALGGESDTVIVVREGHWAIEWIEWIAIHQDNAAAIAIAETLNAERDDYPALDEQDWSEREHDEANYIWKDCFDQSERVKYIRENRDQFTFHDWPTMRKCVRGDYFYGYASELLS